MKTLVLSLLVTVSLFSSCSKQEDTIEVDDDFELSFTQIYNIKMGATIDTTVWNPTQFEYTIDSGGYSLQATQFIKKGVKDTVFHIIDLDFVFPLEVAIDTMKNGDDFWSFYVLDDNLQATNDKQFNALPDGIISIDSINLEQKFVCGKFNYTGVFKNTLGVDIKRKISKGTFSFNYK